MLVVEFSNLVVGGAPSLPPTVIEPGAALASPRGGEPRFPERGRAAARRDPPGDAGEIQEPDGA